MKVTKKYTSKVNIKSSPQLDKIFKKSLKSSKGYIEAIRERFRNADGVLKTQVEDTRGLLNRLNNSPQYILSKKEADALAKLDSGEIPLSECRTAMNQLRDAIESVEGEPYELDHTTMEPVMQAVSLLIVAYQDSRNYLARGGKATDPDFPFESAVKKGQMGFKPNIATLEQKILFLQNLRLYYALWKKNNMNMYEAQKEAQEMAKGGTIDIDYIKQNDLDFTKDGKQVEIQVISKVENRAKGLKQKQFGGARFEGLTGKKLRKGQQALKKQILDAIKNNGVTNIVGSPHVGNTMRKQLSAMSQGKKPQKVKSTSKKKVIQLKIPALEAPKRLTKHIDPKTKQQILAGIALVGTKVQLAGKRRRKDTGDAQRELNKTRAIINRRLPAQVRQNMGRPALENQTGRFSDSVQLLRLQQARKFTHAHYTYLLSPYETFENTGDTRWPTGYNPKPLIEESIRDLAAGAVQDKFTFKFFRV